MSEEDSDGKNLIVHSPSWRSTRKFHSNSTLIMMCHCNCGTFLPFYRIDQLNQEIGRQDGETEKWPQASSGLPQQEKNSGVTLGKTPPMAVKKWAVNPEALASMTTATTQAGEQVPEEGNTSELTGLDFEE